MKLNHKLLDISYPFIKKFFSSPQYQLRILNFHDVQKKDFNNFKKIINKLKKEWNIISPKDFEKKKFISKRSLLLTFDDGYKSQYYVAKQILEPLKIKAIFFVVTDFIQINSKIVSKNFILSNINKEINKNSTRFNEMENMSLNDVLDLSLSGHTIGSHTCGHSKLTIINKNLLARELIHSKNFLKKLLKKNINYFAYTYGDIKSVNQYILSNIKKKYKYIFSGIRGNNYYSNKTNRIYFRDEINASYTENLINSFLYGFTDLYYYRSRKKIQT